MRILVVSAHYPPNFVSGGTLAPQRQAHGLRAMGHEVTVYAGWLGDRPALSSWTDRDSTGMTVRWVVTSPWIEYSDRNNYDNPAVSADFARHLDEVRPDVVHFHSLQTLGVGLLEVAATAGCRVVVTMHDFWWSCARQFFATRDFQPCCLVVSSGVCPCEVDAEWLAARHAHLVPYLACADVVLAVSRISAEVLAANGVDPSRLRVDENGVPATTLDSVRDQLAGRNGGELRLTYTGGHLRLKGVHVLFDAARRLHPRTGWRLAAYGAQPFVDQTGLDLEGLPIDLHPPFDPVLADSIFAQTDVLIVPSVMRETYSLVTREALTRGVAVVCTDSLGPEEVVVHDHNGLVVPTADGAALAAALQRLLLEPGLVERLRDGCQEVRVRSVEEQVAGLERLYRELLPSGATGASMPPVVVSRRRSIHTVLFIAGIQGAPLRYRARLPAEALDLVGVRSEVRHYRDPEVPVLARDADALVVYRVPATTQVLELIADARQRGLRAYFDVDDLIFDPDLAAEIPALSILPPDEADLWMEGVRRYRSTMEACDAYIGSTAELCRHAEAVVGIPAERFANGVSIQLGRLSDIAIHRPRSPGPVRIGYLSGTKTHDHDWLHVEPVIAGLLVDNPDVELWLVGLVRPSRALDQFGTRVRRLPLQPWSELPALLRDIDVNLAPLRPGSRFNDAKSAIKWLEAALTATPTVASPSEPFREAIRHRVNGMLAGSEEEWASALQRLVADDDLRRRLGRRAQRDALLRWSPHLQATRYLEILEGDQGPRRFPTTWEPVVHDEPAMTVALESYSGGGHPPPDPSPGRPLWRHWLVRTRSLAGRVWRSLIDEGPLSTAKRVMSSSRRRWRAIEDRCRWRIAASKAKRRRSRLPER